MGREWEGKNPRCGTSWVVVLFGSGFGIFWIFWILFFFFYDDGDGSDDLEKGYVKDERWGWGWGTRDLLCGCDINKGVVGWGMGSEV